MEQWFGPQTAGIIGGLIGSILGLTGALIGCSCGICVRKGWKKFIYAVFALAVGASVLLLITGLAALALKQPYHVWYVLLLPGAIGSLVFSGLFPVIRKRFIESEMMKMQAKDI